MRGFQLKKRNPCLNLFVPIFLAAAASAIHPWVEQMLHAPPLSFSERKSGSRCVRSDEGKQIDRRRWRQRKKWRLMGRPKSHVAARSFASGRCAFETDRAAVLIGGVRSKPGDSQPPFIVIQEFEGRSQIAGGTLRQKKPKI